MAIPRKDKIFVVLQILVLLGWFIEIDEWHFKLSENLRALALILSVTGGLIILIALIQLNKNLSPFPSPKKDAKLIQGGIFAFARHPIYSGILFVAFGMSVWLGSGYKFIFSVLLLILFHLKSRYEERRLREAFPNYENYKENTGRFFPKFRGRI